MDNEHKQIPPTPVRLPTDLRLWLKHQAVDNSRSLNQEITYRLAKSRAEDLMRKSETDA